MEILKKIISVITTFSVMLASVSVIASASEENRLLIPNARWIHMTSNGDGNPSLTVTFSFVDLDGIWDSSSIYFGTFSNLSTGLDYRVMISSINNSQAADIQLKTPNTWVYDSELYGFATLYSSYGTPYDGGITNMSVSPGEFGTRINKGLVLLNPFSTYSSTMDMKKTLAHEIMHCFNFAHPPYNNMQTIMRQGHNLDWDNYDVPTEYDLRLFRIIYSQNYS